MGCHNGKVASPSYGAKGTLLASPQDVAKRNAQVPSEASPQRQDIFEGRWQDEHGKFVGIIRDGRLMRGNGFPCLLRMDHITGSIELFCNDHVTGRLFNRSNAAVGHFADGKIHWNDGHVWSHQEDIMDAEVIMPPMEPSSIDAQASTGRHEEAHAENAVTENSEGPLLSVTNPALVATRDTSEEQSIQEVYQHEGKSEGELEHQMLEGMKPGEAVGETLEARDTNARSPSFSGDTDSKAFGNNSDITRLPAAPRKERCNVCC
jgi:hypothetical protein